MTAIIFRDDDTSYFTPPQRLEAIYGRVWEAGLPVCLAVIPMVYADTRVYWTDGNPHDPSIPPAFRGRDECFSILDNPALCDFLNAKAAAGLAEICLHGYMHNFYEFITHDRALIRRRLERGLALLKQAFPAADVRTFIAPYDRLSPAAIEELIAAGFHISTRSLNLAPVPALPQIAGHGAAAITTGQTLFVCDDYIFNHKRDPAQSLSIARATLAAHDLSIICNHYWMFYHPWRDHPNPAAYAAWQSLLDDVLLGSETHRVTTFDRFARGNLD